MKLRCVVALLAVVMAGETGFAQGPVSAAQIQGWTQIFSRDRKAGGGGTGEGGQAFVGPSPVFIGVIKQDDGYVALLQLNTGRGAGEVISVREGETIVWDQSKVSEVTWDSLYLRGDATRRVELGHNLRNESMIPVAGPVVYPTLDGPNSGNVAAGALPAVRRPGGNTRSNNLNSGPNGTNSGRNPGRNNGVNNGGVNNGVNNGLNNGSNNGFNGGRNGRNNGFGTPGGLPGRFGANGVVPASGS